MDSEGQQIEAVGSRIGGSNSVSAAPALTGVLFCIWMIAKIYYTFGTRFGQKSSMECLNIGFPNIPSEACFGGRSVFLKLVEFSNPGDFHNILPDLKQTGLCFR